MKTLDLEMLLQQADVLAELRCLNESGMSYDGSKPTRYLFEMVAP